MLTVAPTWDDVLRVLERLETRVTALEQAQEAGLRGATRKVRVSGVPYEVPLESVRVFGTCLDE